MTITLGAALLLASLSSLMAIKIISPVAFRIGLVDIPTGRKRHIGEIPLIGGIAVFVGVLTSSTMILPQSTTLNLYLISSALIVFIGALDDYKELSVEVRIIAQILVSTIVVYGAGVHIESFGNLFELGNIELGWFGYPITILAIIASINAFNMTDGIDGLAGFLSLNTFLSLAVLMIYGGATYSILPLLIAFSTIPYLAFNLGFAGGSAKKIFMGDSGSMFVGLSVVWMLLLGSQGNEAAFSPVTALWLIAIPFWDMCAITIRRISKGKSPFEADRQHLHHIMLSLGCSPTKSLLVILAISLCTSLVGVLGELLGVSEMLMFALYITMFVGYYSLLSTLIDEKNIK